MGLDGGDDGDTVDDEKVPDHGYPDGVKLGEEDCELDVDLFSWSASLQASEQYAAPSDWICLSQARQNWCAHELQAIVTGFVVWRLWLKTCCVTVETHNLFVAKEKKL